MQWPRWRAMSKRTAKYNIPNPTQQNPFALWYKAIGCKGVFALALPTTKLYRDSAGTVREAVETESAGAVASTGDLDTDGNPVPTHKAHRFTYDGSGNPLTDSVTSDDGTWVRTFTYTNGALASDSGWVKQ